MWGAAGAHMRVAWDRRPSAAGGEQDSLAQQGDGRFGAEGYSPSRTEDHPPLGADALVGSEPLAISRAPGSTPATRPGEFCNTWIRLGEGLYRITLGLVGLDELAARSLGGV